MDGSRQTKGRGRRPTLFVAGTIVALAAVALVVALAVCGMHAVRRAHARRSAATRRRYERRRGPCTDVHFEAPLGAEFCADALARLPRAPADPNGSETSAFGRDPFWASAFEWMANRVGDVAQRRLYWIDACVLSMDIGAHVPPGRCALVIDLAGRRVVATTRQPLVWTDAHLRLPTDPLVLVVLDGQPRVFSRVAAR